MRNLENLLKDKDLMKVSRNAASKFKNILSEDEINNCITHAIWRAYKKYDPDNNAKLTSYVHRGVEFECLGLARSNRKTALSVDKYNHGIEDSFKEFEKIDMMDEISQCEEPMLIYDRFYRNMTILELAKQYNVCGETIRIRLEKNLKKIKKSLMGH